jgi:hypothetical protein
MAMSKGRGPALPRAVGGWRVAVQLNVRGADGVGHDWRTGMGVESLLALFTAEGVMVFTKQPEGSMRLTPGGWVDSK